MKWIDSEGLKPPVRRDVLVYCPDWCDSGYQVCYWDGKVFRYDEQSNDDFHTYVDKWAAFLHAD